MLRDVVSMYKVNDKRKGTVTLECLLMNPRTLYLLNNVLDEPYTETNNFLKQDSFKRIGLRNHGCSIT